MNKKYIEILEEIATSIAGTMAPFPTDVVGTVSSSYTKQKMGGQRNGMYKWSRVKSRYSKKQS